MPRQARIDATGAVHHIIARGIEQKPIFKDDVDREDFLHRLGSILTETDTTCFAWSLIPNHFHLLLRTGSVPVATVMRRLLTGYAIQFNRRHQRWGHLFQNRYKSILCQEETYLLELVRYIHLNPLRAKIIGDLNILDRYAFCGHSGLMGYCTRSWQDTPGVLRFFDSRIQSARRKYREFIQDGLTRGRRPDLVGGGLVRSQGGWSAVKALRQSNAHLKGDERILGDSSFVDRVLAEADEAMERRSKAKAEGWDLEKVANRVAEVMNITLEKVWSTGRQRTTVEARSLFCYWAVRELGVSMSEMARRLNISPPAVSKAVARGAGLAKANQYVLSYENETTRNEPSLPAGPVRP
jgi:REP element-mobilizing transposase RayT